MNPSKGIQISLFGLELHRLEINKLFWVEILGADGEPSLVDGL